jgi:hypothetical protein
MGFFGGKSDRELAATKYKNHESASDEKKRVETSRRAAAQARKADDLAYRNKLDARHRQNGSAQSAPSQPTRSGKTDAEIYNEVRNTKESKARRSPAAKARGIREARESVKKGKSWGF